MAGPVVLTGVLANPSAAESRALIARACGVRLLAMDVDGVMTDGRLWYGPEGEQLKSFHVRDGYGIVRLREAGFGLAIISARGSKALVQRARELGIADVLTDQKDKSAALDLLLRARDVSEKEVCYVGDDLPDLGVLRRVGLPVTVPDAPPELLQVAAAVTGASGGEGAVREVCDLLMMAKESLA